MPVGRPRRAGALLLLALAAGCGGDDEAGGRAGAEGGASSTSPPRVETFPVTSHLHVPGPVAYPQAPPAGGDHNPVWQNCGFYSRPVESERAVHSMEHGAVWITYRPDLPQGQVDSLRTLARSRAYVLVSPWRDGSLPAPVVASAWGAQIKLPSATHPALADFVRAYAGAPSAPEPGAPCTGAFGTPE